MATPLNRGACAKSDTEAMTNTNATIIFFIFDVFTTGRQNYTIFHFPTLVGTKLPPFLLLHHQTSSEQSHLFRPRIVWSLREARRNSPLFVFVLNELDTHAFDHTIVHRKKREARLLTLAHKSVHRSLFQDGIDKMICNSETHSCWSNAFRCFHNTATTIGTVMSTECEIRVESVPGRPKREERSRCNI